MFLTIFLLTILACVVCVVKKKKQKARATFETREDVEKEGIDKDGLIS